jgi:hypothetical protein
LAFVGFGWLQENFIDILELVWFFFGACLVFFFEMKTKELPHPLIKKKRVTQLINRKPD